MNRRYYSDAVSNYLILRCPPESAAGYQYRMLAVNRIPGILPCSMRTIDGETYLYYDVTSRESLDVMYAGTCIPGREVRKFLYGMAEMIRSLSDFLLDDTGLMLGLDYIFYDFETERFCFTYYPEEQQKDGMQRLFRELAERIDPEDSDDTVVVYRLCDLSERPGFVLRDELLDHEYAVLREEQDSWKNAHTMGGPTRIIQQEDEFCRNSDRRINSRYDNPETAYDADGYHDASDPLWEEKDRTAVESPERNRKNAGGKKEKKPGGILLFAVLFLIGAAVLECSRLFITFDEEGEMSLRSGVIACLGLALLTACYGVIITYRKNRRDAEEEKEYSQEQRKNAMIPAVEYGREDGRQ